MTALSEPTPDHSSGAASDAVGADSSVWLVGQSAARTQRAGRYLPASVAHPGRMLPDLARTAIATYTRPGDLVLDPMCGIGTSLVEAVHAGRDAVGIEYEPRWVDLAVANLDLAEQLGAAGRATVIAGDARRAIGQLSPMFTGQVRLLLTSPPYGLGGHGRIDVPGTEKIRKWYHRYGDDTANLAHRPLPELLDGFTAILRGCLPLLAPDGVVVLTTRPYRTGGQLVDLPGAVLHAATSLGLSPVGRYVAIFAGVHSGHVTPRGSFFQMRNVRAARSAGLPLRVPAHEDVLVMAVNPTRPGRLGERGQS